MSKIKLEDVDGTVPARAALVMVNLEDPWGQRDLPNLMRSDFTEAAPDNTANPIRACWGLWEGTKADWPGYTATVVSNERAKYLDWVPKMEALGITGNTPEQYIEAREGSFL